MRHLLSDGNVLEVEVEPMGVFATFSILEKTAESPTGARTASLRMYEWELRKVLENMSRESHLGFNFLKAPVA